MKTIVRPVLQTARTKLMLIRMAPEHAEMFFATIEENRPYMNGWRQHLWTKYQNALELRGDLPDIGILKRVWYGIWHGEQIIGAVSVTTSPRPSETGEEEDSEVTDDLVNYWLDRKHEGNNFACPALLAFTDELFANGWERLVVVVGADRPGSRVILPRVGFVPDDSSPYAPKGSGNFCYVKYAPTKKAPE